MANNTIVKNASSFPPLQYPANTSVIPPHPTLVASGKVPNNFSSSLSINLEPWISQTSAPFDYVYSNFELYINMDGGDSITPTNLQLYNNNTLLTNISVSTFIQKATLPEAFQFGTSESQIILTNNILGNPSWCKISFSNPSTLRKLFLIDIGTQSPTQGTSSIRGSFALNANSQVVNKIVLRAGTSGSFGFDTNYRLIGIPSTL